MSAASRPGLTDGLRALLTGVLDYAGLFPPASLPLDSALRNYARYRQEPDAWMLGRFVVPAARLEELEPNVGELFASGPPLALAILGRGGGTAADWTSGVKADARAIAGWRMRHGGRVRVEVFETRLPADGAAACIKVLSETLGPTPPTFYEATLGAVDAIAAAGAGYKLRCGGLTSDAFPSADAIARTLLTCRAARVPLKLTAGLHHPLPRFDAGVAATMHGFVNVLLAGVFAATGSPDAGALTELLQDAEAAHFSFGEGVAWKHLTATASQVAAARREAVLSFGSCSFDEPRDDLRALGWL
jgi:hypothetical protein